MTAITLHAATPQEILALYRAIPEFNSHHTLADLHARLDGRESSLLIARIAGQAVGFKIGYALDSQTVYSWLGGVLPAWRRAGVAQSLLQAQQQWAIQHGYRRIEVKTRNGFPAMLMMLIKNGYSIIQLQPQGAVADYRLRLAKALCLDAA
ncbi:GNAT family N-acetyltransferase [Edwardsiella tarda]|uniref:GNAT family N-acetyltransferase n=1 Tax=Edwardsiella tarda TaxID=636 RepID=UPI00351C734C